MSKMNPGNKCGAVAESGWFKIIATIVLATTGAALYAGGSIFIYAAGTSSSQPMVYVGNGITGFVMCIPFTIFNPPDLSACYSNRFGLVAVGFLQTVGQFALLFSIPQLGPGKAMSLYYTLPIFAIALSFVFLKDRIKLINIICAVCSIIGVICITRSGLDYTTTQSEEGGKIHAILVVLIALAAPCFHAGVFVVRKHLANNGIDALTTVFSFSLQFAFAASVFCTVTNSWSLPDNFIDIFFLAGSGPATILGLLGVFTAIALSSPSLVSIVLPVNVLFVYIAQVIFIKSLSVQWTAIVGAALIGCSSVGVAVGNIFDEIAGEENHSNEEESLIKDKQDNK